jgi:hypothetical protein
LKQLRKAIKTKDKKMQSTNLLYESGKYSLSWDSNDGQPHHNALSMDQRIEAPKTRSSLQSNKKKAAQELTDTY